MIISNNKKICSKSPHLKNKPRLSLNELYKLLEEQKLPLTKTDEKTNKRRRKNYNEVCDELLQKNILEYVEINKDLNQNCLTMTYQELRKFATTKNVSNVGTKNDICNRLRENGFVFTDMDLIQAPNNKCYKLSKTKCNTDTSCQWFPQIIDKNNKFEKRLLIKRISIIDMINGTKPKEDYNKLNISKLKNILTQKGFDQIHSSCKSISKINPDLGVLSSLQQDIYSNLDTEPLSELDGDLDSTESVSELEQEAEPLMEPPMSHDAPETPKSPSIVEAEPLMEPPMEKSFIEELLETPSIEDEDYNSYLEFNPEQTKESPMESQMNSDILESPNNKPNLDVLSETSPALTKPNLDVLSETSPESNKEKSKKPLKKPKKKLNLKKFKLKIKPEKEDLDLEITSDLENIFN